MSSSTDDPQGLLEGISEKTKKVDLIDRLRKVAAMVHQQQDKRASKLQEVSDRVRAKRQTMTHDLRTVTVSSTHDEWIEAYEFLDEFGDLLPEALARLNEGAKIAASEFKYDQENDTETDV